jgi:hypothetical protein
MMRRLSRARVDRLERRLARLARGQHRAPAGPQCALCGRVQDPAAPPWAAAGWPVVAAPGGLSLCALRCDAPVHLGWRMAQAPGAPADATVVAHAVSRMVGLARADRRWAALWAGLLSAVSDLERRAAAARARRPDDGGPDLAMAAVLEAWVEMLVEDLAALLAQAEQDPEGAAAAVRLAELAALEQAPADVQGPARAHAAAQETALLAAAAERLRPGGPLPDPHTGTAAWRAAVDRAREALQAAADERGAPSRSY